VRQHLILVVGHIKMHGRTLFKIGLLFPLLILVVLSVAEIFFSPIGPETRHFLFPPFLIGYVLFTLVSWQMINSYSDYKQGRNYLLIAPFVLCIAMSASRLLYHAILYDQTIDDLYESLAAYIFAFIVSGFLYISAFSVILGLLYLLGLAREYVPNYAIKGTSV
jgi:hypothetical protein